LAAEVEIEAHKIGSALLIWQNSHITTGRDGVTAKRLVDFGGDNKILSGETPHG
jgi:hypothetical protein